MGLRMGLVLVLAALAFTYSVGVASADTPTAVPTAMATATGTAVPTSTSTAVATPLLFSVGIPDEVGPNTWFYFTTWITNPTEQARTFDVQVTFGFEAWGGEADPPATSPGTEIYWNVGVANALTRSWRGTVPANSAVWLNEHLRSGTTLGSYLFATVVDNGVTRLVKNLTVASATPTVTATVVPTTTAQQPVATLGYERGYQWQRGETRMLLLSLSSPSLVYQWQGGQFTSTCGVVDLPGGLYSELNLRQLSYGWYVTVPATAPLGKCTIDGSVFLLGVGTTLRFYTELNVTEAQTPTTTVVPTSTATPIGSPTPQPTVTPNSNAPHTELRPPSSYLAGQVIEIPVFINSYGQEINGGEFEISFPEYPTQIVTRIEFSPAEGIIELPDGRATPLKRLVAYGSLYRTLHDGEQVGVLRLTTSPDAQNHLIVKVRRNILARGGASLGTSPEMFHIVRLTMGDANADGVVSILDFSLLANSFNQRQGQPGFDARTDFNVDGAVSILDFSILASHFDMAVPGLK